MRRIMTTIVGPGVSFLIRRDTTRQPNSVAYQNPVNGDTPVIFQPQSCLRLMESIHCHLYSKFFPTALDRLVSAHRRVCLADWQIQDTRYVLQLLAAQKQMVRHLSKPVGG